MPLARRTLLALLALLVCLAVGARGALLRSSRSRSCVALDLRGGKRQRTSAKPGKRSMTFTDIKRNDSANEYYAGGLDENAVKPWADKAVDILLYLHGKDKERQRKADRHYPGVSGGIRGYPAPTASSGATRQWAQCLDPMGFATVSAATVC